MLGGFAIIDEIRLLFDDALILFVCFLKFYMFLFVCFSPSG
jgi:hypothetical protein